MKPANLNNETVAESKKRVWKFSHQRLDAISRNARMKLCEGVISATDYAVVEIVIRDILWHTNGRCCPSLEDVATRLGKSRRTVSACFTAIENAGIWRRQQRGATNFHDVFFPDEDLSSRRDEKETERNEAKNPARGVEESCEGGGRKLLGATQKVAHLYTEDNPEGNYEDVSEGDTGHAISAGKKFISRYLDGRSITPDNIMIISRKLASGEITESVAECMIDVLVEQGGGYVRARA